mgnify:CR=1 FL=1
MLQNSNSTQQLAAEFTVEHSDDEGGEKEKEKQPSINFREAMEHIRQLKHFLLQNAAEELKMTSELLVHIETNIYKNQKIQTKIVDFIM